jgi:hypothetical protein
MTATWFDTIKLPYLSWKRGPRAAGRRSRLKGTPNLPQHLLCDIGLLDSAEPRDGGMEVPATARDLIDRYR